VFSKVLLAKASHRANPDIRREKIEATLCWEDLSGLDCICHYTQLQGQLFIIIIDPVALPTLFPTPPLRSLHSRPLARVYALGTVHGAPSAWNTFTSDSHMNGTSTVSPKVREDQVDPHSWWVMSWCWSPLTVAYSQSWFSLLWWTLVGFLNIHSGNVQM
jgi:hypothetical protein